VAGRHCGIQFGGANMLIFQPYDVMIDKRIAERAYYHWERRGRPVGSPEVDWYHAVEEERREFRWRGVGI
ncbi:MAG TPA: DUF2934 domain-containing protein, partial [Candidatus Acidoferrales bacterium]|nr:DUF2934 domain-containing protein [Candidatus Acidoferrales bacterium]